MEERDSRNLASSDKMIYKYKMIDKDNRNIANPFHRFIYACSGTPFIMIFKGGRKSVYLTDSFILVLIQFVLEGDTPINSIFWNIYGYTSLLSTLYHKALYIVRIFIYFKCTPPPFPVLPFCFSFW